MEPISLTTVGRELLADARSASAGRTARALRPGRDRMLRQTLLALTAGARLDDHENPGEAGLQVIEGRVRLGTAEDSAEATAGEYLVIPAGRHHLSAIEDSVVLLTVALRIAGQGSQSELPGRPPT